MITTEASRPQTALQWLRQAGNLVNLSTPLGLVVAAIGGAEARPGPSGLHLAEHYRLAFPVADAFTIGNVLITRSSWAALLAANPELLGHEQRHSWQYLYCGGLGFLVLYGGCLVWSVLRTGDRAAANVFERQAGLSAGGYRDVPVRPLGRGLRAVLGQAVGWLRSRS